MFGQVTDALLVLHAFLVLLFAPSAIAVRALDVNLFDCTTCDGVKYCRSKSQARFATEIQCYKINASLAREVDEKGKKLTDIFITCNFQLPEVSSEKRYWIKAKPGQPCNMTFIQMTFEGYNIAPFDCNSGFRPYICESSILPTTPSFRQLTSDRGDQHEYYLSSTRHNYSVCESMCQNYLQSLGSCLTNWSHLHISHSVRDQLNSTQNYWLTWYKQSGQCGMIGVIGPVFYSQYPTSDCKKEFFCVCSKLTTSITTPSFSDSQSTITITSTSNLDAKMSDTTTPSLTSSSKANLPGIQSNLAWAASTPSSTSTPSTVTNLTVANTGSTSNLHGAQPTTKVWIPVNGGFYRLTDSECTISEARQLCTQDNGQLSTAQNLDIPGLVRALTLAPLVPIKLWVHGTENRCRVTKTTDTGCVLNIGSSSIQNPFELTKSSIMHKGLCEKIVQSTSTASTQSSTTTSTQSSTTTSTQLSTTSTRPSTTTSTQSSSTTSTQLSTTSTRSSTTTSTQSSTTTSTQLSTTSTRPSTTKSTQSPNTTSTRPSTVTSTQLSTTSTRPSTTTITQSSNTKSTQTSNTTITRPSTTTSTRPSTTTSTQSSNTTSTQLSYTTSTQSLSTTSTRPSNNTSTRSSTITTTQSSTTTSPRPSTPPSSKSPTTTSTWSSTTTSSQSSTTGNITNVTSVTDWFKEKQREYYVNKNQSSFSNASDICRSQLNASMVFFTNALQYLDLVDKLHLTKGTFWVGVAMNSSSPECLQLKVQPDSTATLTKLNCQQELYSICSRSANITDVLTDPLFVRLIADMTIDKSTTQRSRRQRVSVFEERKTATAVGSVGVGFIITVFTIIALMDLSKIKCPCCRSKSTQVKVIHVKDPADRDRTVSDSSC